MNSSVKTFLVVLITVIAVSAGLILVSAKQKSKELTKTSEYVDYENDEKVAGVDTNESQSYDSSYIERLAKFMTDKGMVMYGAYWCSHCNEQKKEFGEAFKYVDYVECDAQGENANPDECVAQGIKGYPTWIFEGNKYSGKKTLAELARIVGFSNE